MKPGDVFYDDNLYRTDDVPVYLEFLVKKSWRAQFPNFYSDYYGVYDLTQPEYNDIKQRSHLQTLLKAGISNIKVVSSIKIDNIDYVGSAIPEPQCMVLTVEGVAPRTVIHEYGHMVWLGHRLDAGAVMYPDEPGGSKVNRIERDWFHGIVVGYID